MNFFTINCFLLVIMSNCKAKNCSNERNENNQILCCTNFYRDKGECKECLPGCYGMNCRSSCVYPTFGIRCMNTCGCNISDCDHVSGCQGNDTEIQITAVNTRSWISLSVNPNFPLSYSSAPTPDYSTEEEELYNDRDTMKDNDFPTVYTEIDERSEQESESNTMRTTVTSTSFTSLNGIETRRPQLPVRNTQLNFF